jgi:hypothetical protein
LQDKKKENEIGEKQEEEDDDEKEEKKEEKEGISLTGCFIYLYLCFKIYITNHAWDIRERKAV